MLFGSAKNQRFFQLLRSAAENAEEVANHLTQLLEQPARHPELSPLIKGLETKGDRITHDLFALIHGAFTTPIERSNLADIGTSIDSVVDCMEAAAARIGIYQVKTSDRFLRAFGQIARAQCAELVAALDLLAGNKIEALHDRNIRINTLENQGDDNLRDGLSELFQGAAADPIYFVTMKEIYETLEEATDRAEDVANLLEGIVMKHG
jgi:uncharacterized protein Yka (UPF0111/DUF47 family)